MVGGIRDLEVNFDSEDESDSGDEVVAAAKSTSNNTKSSSVFSIFK